MSIISMQVTVSDLEYTLRRYVSYPGVQASVHWNN